jgi:hypothetical protein
MWAGRARLIGALYGDADAVMGGGRCGGGDGGWVCIALFNILCIEFCLCYVYLALKVIQSIDTLQSCLAEGDKVSEFHSEDARSNLVTDWWELKNFFYKQIIHLHDGT